MKHRKEHSDFSHVNDLYKALHTLESSAEIAKFMGDLCTPAELEALADRWLVARKLNLPTPPSYREINAQTGVSITTVGRVARFMAQGFGGYKIALGRVED